MLFYFHPLYLVRLLFFPLILSPPLSLSFSIFVCLRPSAVRDSASPVFVHGCLIYGSL